MKITSKYLYELLPAYYRLLDHEQGGPLKALVEVLAREAGIVEEDISRLYENWFIETCDEWVVPYIGDLLGVRNLHEIDEKAAYSRRAYVANTLSYRRRKGTTPVLEQLAFDTTGWRARVVEFFQLLITSQHMNHIRLHSLATPDLRRMNQLDLLNTAFDTIAHTVDVRRISTGLGKYNIPNIGLYLWRLEAYPLEKSDARSLASPSDGRFTFSALGLDRHLFNRKQAEHVIEHLAEEINVPGPLRRQALFDELEGRRQALVDHTPPAYTFFNDTFDAKYPPVFQLFLNDSSTAIPPDRITICNLGDWKLPSEEKIYKNKAGSEVHCEITAAVDPVLGRIALSTPNIGPNTKVSVSYQYGFSGDVGGGPYDRWDSLIELQDLYIDWHVGVSKDHTPVQSEIIYKKLSDAIDAWNGLTDIKTGLITIMDNRSYMEDLSGVHKIIIPEGRHLFIIAANWPEKNGRQPGSYKPKMLRPHILGDIEVQGTAPANSSSGGILVLNGLLIEGNLTILGKPTVPEHNLQGCVLTHCTLVPEKGGLEVQDQSRIININLERSICGSVKVASEDAKVNIKECIIDHQGGTAVDAEKSQLNIQKSTLFGTIRAQTLEAGNSIFTDLIEKGFITRRQAGCVRFSYLPYGSVTPRRFRCQPELEIQSQIKAKEQDKGDKLDDIERKAIEEHVTRWILPVFNATLYGHRAYGQLGTATPSQLTTGADNASEMGVFNYLQQPQREANLRIALEEYLRLGLEAGILFVT